MEPAGSRSGASNGGLHSGGSAGLELGSSIGQKSGISMVWKLGSSGVVRKQVAAWVWGVDSGMVEV